LGGIFDITTASIFVEPDDVQEIVRGASKFVPYSDTVEVLMKDSVISKHVPCSATEYPATRYQLPATPSLGWERYERENSWEENTWKVVEALCE
jgi:hypothetical protein